MRKTPNFAVALVALGAFTQLATRPALAAENCYGSYTSCRALTGPDVDGTCRAIYNACVKRNAGKASGQASGSRLVSGAHITVDGSLVTPAGKPSTWNGKATNSVVVKWGRPRRFCRRGRNRHRLDCPRQQRHHQQRRQYSPGREGHDWRRCNERVTQRWPHQHAGAVDRDISGKNVETIEPYLVYGVSPPAAIRPDSRRVWLAPGVLFFWRVLRRQAHVMGTAHSAPLPVL